MTRRRVAASAWSGSGAPAVETLVELLRARSRDSAGDRGFTFLADGETEAGAIGFAELDARARAIAAALQDLGAAGERAVLLYPTSLEFIAAWFGCLYAGTIAIPVYPPQSSRALPRLRAIVEDARPRLVLTTAALQPRLLAACAEIPALPAAACVATDTLEAGLAERWREPAIDGGSIAFIQYTSGSTATPRGVLLSHRNLLHNSECIRQAFRQAPDSVVVSWLPLYHDMGLIGGVLQPLYVGGRCILMSPVAFLQQPSRWLRAVSRYRATTSGGPNFAYELCARKVPAPDREALDLSSWRLAFNGAEPVRAETLERFAAAFAPCGFRRESFYPCYGLAEATLFVAGGKGRPVVERFAAAALAAGEARAPVDGDEPTRSLVGCGSAWLGQRLTVVDPKRGVERPPGRVGEVWLAGPSVAAGYWERPAESAATFGARLAQGKAGFLRTGDLGFLRDGELFVTGRLKDLIIVRGRNLYPQDIEATAEQSHPALRPGCGAAFAIDLDGEERLVLVLEVEPRAQPRLDVAQTAGAVRRAVAETHEVQAHEVVLVAAGAVPRTSSGKVQRGACRQAYLELSLPVVGRSLASDAAEMLPALGLEALLAAPAAERPGALLGWLANRIADLGGVAGGEEAWTLPLTAWGLDSLALVELRNLLESELGVAASLGELLAAQSLHALAADLTRQLGAPAGVAPEPALLSAAELANGVPLSSGQRALWLLDRLAPESGVCLLGGAVRTRSPLDTAALARALRQLARRHPALRTTFVLVDGEPRQVVHQVLDPDFAIEDVAAGGEAALRRRLQEVLARPFDLTRGPLLRAHLWTCAGGESVLALSLHHLVADLWSLTVLARDLGALYRRQRGEAAPLPALEVTPFDCFRRQEQRLAGPEGERLWDYWRRQLADLPDACELPTDRPRPATRTFRGAGVPLRLPPALLTALRAAGDTAAATPFMVLLGAFQVLLHRLTGQEDLVVGAPAAGRSSRRSAPLVGYFVNLLPLRVEITGDSSFGAFLGRVRRCVLDALAYQDLPLPLLAERVQPARDAGRPPLFQTVVALQKPQDDGLAGLAACAVGHDAAGLELGGTLFETVGLEPAAVQFDLTFVAAELDGGLSASLQYDTGLFDSVTALRLARQLRGVLEAIAADPGRRLADIPLLSPGEQQQVLVAWNDTAADLPAGPPPHALVELQAARRPNALAIDDGEERLSYRQLNERANRLARLLESIGVGGEAVVALLLPRSADLVVAQLAVLKAGGTFLPLEPAVPAERLEYLLTDSAARVLVTRTAPPRAVPDGCRTVVLEASGPWLARLPPEDRPRATDPLARAYVIYTSGSTGWPKGVEIPHAGLLNLVHWHRRAYGVGATDRAALVASPAFDASVWEIWPYITAGASLHVPDEAVRAAPGDLLRWLAAHAITVCFLPTLLAEAVLAEEWPHPMTLRALLTGGDRLTRRPAAGASFRLINHYGPTETSVVATAAEVLPEGVGRPAIGRPIANFQAYVLDARLQPLPPGVPGELWLGGTGLARGYLRQPDLTAERFRPSPFAAAGGARLYRTGDLARHRYDGSLEFLGRLDQQVKIRGVRIEPAEIEAALRRLPRVREAVVVAREDPAGTPRLVAYCTGAAGDPPAAAELREFLRRSLPEAMVPSAFVVLAALPLTATGKVDRRALPVVAPGAAADGPPETPLEEILAALWCEVLGVERAGRDDDFFALGGHSLRAVRLIWRVRELLGAELPLAAVFESPTPAALAAVVERSLQGSPAAPLPPLLPQPSGGGRPLSFAQQRLWFLERLNPGTPTYSIGFALRLTGPLDALALARSLDEIVRRHTSLRTAFPVRDGQPLQEVVAVGFALPCVDLRQVPAAQRATEARRLAQSAARRPLDLERPPLLRGDLLRLAPDEHLLLLVLHHIAADGWSLDVLGRELAALYPAFAAGRASPLPELPVQYAEYAAWQRQWLDGAALARRIEAWRRLLAGVPPLLPLPTDHPRPTVPSQRGGTEPLHLPAEEAAALRALGRAHGATLFMTLLAAFGALLARLTGEEDLVIGSPVANRERPETAGMIGCFVNLLPLRLELAGDPTVDELLHRVRRAALAAYVHRDLPFEALVEALAAERAAQRTPLVQVVLALAAEPLALPLPGLIVEPSELDRGTAKFDLTLTLLDTGGGLRGSLEYDADLFARATARRLASQFQLLVSGLAVSSAARLSELPLLSAAERAQVLVEWNQTAAPLPHGTRVHELVAAQAAHRPAALALAAGAVRVSYDELERRAAGLAGSLRAVGVGPERLVAVLADGGPERVIAQLAVLKAGGAYLPLDPAHPPERLAALLADARPLVLLAERGLAGGLPEHAAATVLFDLAAAPPAPAATAPAPGLADESLAYVIYTSGSTGAPKGVAVPHRGLLNLVCWHLEAYGPTPADRASQLAAPSFDASVWEVWPYLCAGASLHWPEEERRASPAALADWLAEEGITLAFLPTPLAEAVLLEAGRERLALRALLTGGDRLTRRPDGALPCPLFNHYGPTESTVVTTWAAVAAAGDGEPPPIGRPIANHRVYVLDRWGSPVPAGVPGELAIAGGGLARGYLHRPDLTAERFIPDPFATAPGARLYRTGDLVRHRADGSLEFLGRSDEQLKVRGVRIEPGEIEAAIAACPGVRQVAVAARADAAGTLRLVAYVVPERPGAAHATELRRLLRRRLPEAMLPAVFLELPELPLTRHGKVDRRALPEPPAAGREGAAAPRTPVEELLAALWAEVLGIEGAGPDDDFFALGGHSLLGAQLLARVRAVFSTDVPLRVLFEAPTLGAMAERIDEALAGQPAAAQPPIVPPPRDEEPPLSFAQQRLWFLDRLQPGTAAYNIAFGLRLRGALDVPVLAAALAHVVHRHESLRTTFAQAGGTAVQVIAPPGPWSLPVVDLSRLVAERAPSEARRLARAEAARPFDLATGPLFRAQLVRLAADDHSALFTLHHVISDGWSMGVLSREVAALYAAFRQGRPSPLPALPFQYADFAAWQRRWLDDDVLAEQLGYWRRQLAGDLPALELPADRPRPAVQSFRGATQSLLLSPELTAALRACGRRHGATLFIFLLAGFDALLHRYTGQEDLVLGSPIANRNRVEIEGLIGFFVNTLVLRVRMDGEIAFGELIARAREVALGAYAHQDLPFEKLVEELQPERDLARNPLFQVMLALQNAPMPALELPELTLTGFAAESGSTPFDLFLNATEVAAGLSLEVHYGTDLFDAPSARRLLRHLATLVAGAAAEPERPLWSLPLLGRDERSQLLHQWNDSAFAVAGPRCVHELVESQARRTPERTAVVFAGRTTTYAALDRMADQVARHLGSHGAAPGALVGICVERSECMVAAVLGTLKAGAAYVPLDPGFPTRRLQTILEEAGLPLLLTERRLADELPPHGARLIFLDDLQEERSPAPAPPPLPAVDPRQPAYVLFTSGSTGRPKGVVVPHSAVVSLIAAISRRPGFSAADTLFAVTTLAFDIATLELFLPLATGARLVVASRDEAADAALLAAAMAAANTTVVQATPATFRMLIDGGWRGLPGLKVFCGGEALMRELADAIRARCAELWNLYGPTETTIYSAGGQVAAGSGPAPIGGPVDNTELYVLDRRLQPMPIGVAGELYIGGAGVADGYLGRPERTAGQFLPDPFSGRSGARMYRTGDLVRRRGDGALEFLGRFDHQVKLRGFRIELGDIEAALDRHPAVRQSVVLAREDTPGDRRLVAYLVLARDGEAPGPGEREENLDAEQLSRWRETWERTYAEGAAGTEPAFNIAGWNSSSTGRPIPAEEMRQWVDHTVARILACRPRSVLEIGCGTGLLLLRIAGRCERYWASDFSPQALASVERQLPLLGDSRAGVTLLERAAEDFTGIPEQAFDAVLLNSVVQYFPDVDYLLRVLAGAVAATRSGGVVWIGDVRSLLLQEAFQTSIELDQAEDSLAPERLRRRVQRRIGQEQELLLDPAFFHALRERLPRVGHAEVQLKRGAYRNELSKFRYDVVLHVAPDQPPPAAARWLDWRRDSLGLNTLRRLLREDSPRELGVRRIPNARVENELRAAELLAAEGAPATAREIREAVCGAPRAGVDPEALWRLGEELGYAVTVAWSEGGVGLCDALFQRPEAGAPALLPAQALRPRPWRAYANDPLRGTFARRLAPSLRDFLERRLPDYMVPAAFVLMETLPLTPSGKVDRRALPAPDAGEGRPAGVYVGPRTPTEEVLAESWSAVLGLERIGVEDNFFALGGHSLLATQLLARVRERLGVDLPLRALFDAPTLAALARRVEECLGRAAEAPLPPVEHVPRDRPLPLSFSQQRLWVLDRLEPGSAAYNVPFALRIRGGLDRRVLGRAVDEAVRRHEALRTTFREVDGEPVQQITPPVSRGVPLLDLDGLPAARREEETLRLAATEARRPFDLARGPLLRAALLRLGAADHALLLTLHHIVCDGWSLDILLREVSALYAAFAAGGSPALPELPIQYADFAVWQRRWLQGEVLERRLDYWRRHLRGLTPLELPMARSRPPAPGARGASHAWRLPAEALAGLRELCRCEGVTPFIVLLAALKAVLHRYTGQADLTIGVPVAGRAGSETEGLVGFFLNTLVIRTGFGGDPSFAQALARVREAMLAAFAHQEVPFERVLEELQPERDLARTPLFQVLFNLLSFGTREVEIPGLETQELPLPVAGVKFDLTLYAREQREAIELEFHYNADLFAADQIAELAQHFTTLVAAAVREPGRHLSELPLAGARERAARERRQVRTTPAAPRRESGRSDGAASIPQRFTRIARRHAARPAVVTGREVLSYGQLHRRSRRAAAALRRCLRGEPARVGLLFEHDAPMIVAVLAALEAGATYVPLDPSYPEERLAFMLRDADAALLLTEGPLLARAHRLAHGGLPCLALEACAAAEPLAALAVTPPELPAYILYTSGSTGEPKGVAQSHRNVVHHIDVYAEALRITPADRLSLLASYSFDAAVMDIFGALLSGAALCPFDVKREGIAALPQWLRRRAITIYHSTPTLYRRLLEALDGTVLPAARLVVLGGETCLVRDLDGFRAHFPPAAVFVNGLGPTESTLGLQFLADAAPAPPRETVPAGFAVEGTRVSLWNGAGEQVATYGVGEIAISSPAIALGYWRRPELTAVTFVPDPSVDGGRSYRTGDLGRWLADGSIEFVGRADHQVKIRGQRVELGEIEGRLNLLPEIREAVVVARDGVAGEPRLDAYVLAADGGIAPAALRRALRAHLPEAMIPASFTVLDAWPLTPTGKIDRAALPPPREPARAPAADALPLTPVEELLGGIWSELFQRETCAATDDFFELGGHSLLALQLLARVRRDLDVEVPLRAVFETPTLGALARRVEAERRAGARLPRPPVVASPRSAELPLSLAQQRLWFLTQLSPGDPAYNVPAAIALGGRLDVAALRAALREVVARHEALRTTFSERGGTAFQRVGTAIPAALPLLDLAALPQPLREAEARRLERLEAGRPFDLAAGPLFRASLLRLAAGEHELLVTAHHIVSDGWSLGILAREVAALYGALAAGRGSPLPPLPFQYGDFARWQRSWLDEAALGPALAYWRERLRGAPALLELPADRPRPSRPSLRGGRRAVQLETEVAAGLKSLARREGATPFMVLLAGLQVLLARITGEEDLCIGTPVAGRDQLEFEGLIGFFVNTLVLRGDLSGDPLFRELLARARQVCLAAHSHAELPFERLIEELRPERRLDVSPLYQVMLTLQSAPRAPITMAELELRPLDLPLDRVKLDLSLVWAETPEGLVGTIEYASELFDAATVARWAGQLANLLRAVAADGVERRLSQLPLLRREELHQLLVEWGDTAVSDERDELCVHELVAAQVERTPEAVAAVCGEQRLTYRQLARLSERLARSLRDAGVGRGCFVPVLVDGGLELVVALLGVLEAGAAFVPLDPEWPAARLEGVLRELGSRCVLVRDGALAAITAAPCWQIDMTESDPAAPERNGRGRAAMPEDPIYAIYTSGSTGRPKGVVVPHRGIVNRFVWMHGFFGAAAARRVLQTTRPVYDSAVWQLLWPLTLGGATVLTAPQRSMDLDHVADLVRRHEVTMTDFVPAVFNLLVEQVEAGLLPAATFDSLRAVIVGGEEMGPAAASAFRAQFPEVTLVNLYGPTEASIGCVCHRVAGDCRGRVPIGRSIANVQALVLDRWGQIAPIGVAGELCLAGRCLGLGYLGEAEQTRRVFVPHPFPAPGRERIYRTGDQARLLPGGEIDFLGRRDRQVKLRGLRIELGEIEAALRQHPGIRQAAVVLWQNPEAAGDRRLAAYVAARGGEPVSERELAAHLAARLPAFMVPGVFAVLDALPLTPGGKVDRGALPAPGSATLAAPAAPAAPRNHLEETLAGLWAELLRHERVGIHDDFFALGGHSLLAVQVVAHVRRVLRIELSVRALFDAPTVAGLARRIEVELAGGAAAPAPIVPAPRRREAPLSFSQQRLWLQDRLEPGSHWHNTANVLRLTGPLDRRALTRALREILRRHESLRTRFPARDGHPFQVVDPVPAHPLAAFDLAALAAGEREPEVERRLAQEVARPFDLARGPLFRSLLFRLTERHHVLATIVHHIVWDAWSSGVFLRELSLLYAAALRGETWPLREPSLQYADYAIWQRERLRAPVVVDHLAYWRRQLAEAAYLELATDHPRREAPSFRGARHPFELPETLSRKIHALARRQEATPFTLLLAAFAGALFHLSGQEDIVVGVPVSGRGHAELEELIGYFINAVAVRADLRGAPSYLELVRRLRATLLDAYAHQELPFEMVVEALRPKRRPGRQPFFEVVFNYYLDPQLDVGIDGLAAEPYPLQRETAKNELTLYLREAGGRFAGAIAYNSDLFAAGTVARLARTLELLLQRAVAAPETSLPELIAALRAGEQKERIEHEQALREVRRDTLRALQRGAPRIAAQPEAQGEEVPT
jgi:amino acid adenylation domain-containing protein